MKKANKNKEKIKITKNIKKEVNEFKTFISRGNVVDMAIGVIIGGHDFSNLSITVGTAKIMYGAFIQNIIDFLIIAASIFIFIKIINALIHKKEEAKEKDAKKEEPKVSEEVLLLREIRDSLQTKKITKKN